MAKRSKSSSTTSPAGGSPYMDNTLSWSIRPPGVDRDPGVPTAKAAPFRPLTGVWLASQLMAHDEPQE